MEVNKPKNIVIEMPFYRFHDIKEKMESIEKTIKTLKIHEGFKQSIVSDIQVVNGILTKFKRG